MICGNMFVPYRVSQQVCSNPECRRLAHMERQRRYEETHPNRDRERRERRRTKNNDHIIGEGYAERQIANTLKMVGRVEI